MFIFTSKSGLIMDDQNQHSGGSGRRSESSVGETTVDLDTVIARLKTELRIVVETIQSLERLESDVPLTRGDWLGNHLQPHLSFLGNRGGRRAMGEEERKRNSERQKRYWIEWRRKKAETGRQSLS